jgi:hypothetical protein
MGKTPTWYREGRLCAVTQFYLSMQYTGLLIHAKFPIRNDEPLVVLDTLLDWWFKYNASGKQSFTETLD